MEPRRRQHLEKQLYRYNELNDFLSSPAVVSDLQLLRDYSKEAAGLKELVELFVKYQRLEQEYQEAHKLTSEQEPELQELAAAEMSQLQQQLQQQEQLIQEALRQEDETDNRNVYLEIRAGAGGDEAAIFAGDLLAMYQRYADKVGWKYKVVNLHQSELGGFKQVVIYLTGKKVYGEMKFESGTHRVQRVPKTEAKGRLHTSTCTVAILPEATAADHIEINRADLRIDTYRASGAGGQHVNKTDSAVRITHLPTGIVTECQDERSQHRNKEKALAVLQARLVQEEKRKLEQETSSLRKSLVGSGDRAEKIRTYNYPQNRVTDHRIALTLYALDAIMLGDLDLVVKPLKTQETELQSIL